MGKVRITYEGAWYTARVRWAIGFWVAILVLRMGYVLVAPSVDPFLRRDPLHGDARVHDTIAWTLASEGRYEYHKGLQVAPAYMWLMAGVYMLVGHEPQAVRVVNGLLSLLMLWGVWRIANRWLGTGLAYWVVGLGALHPHLLMISGWLYTENLALPLLVWAMERATAGWNWRNALACGVLMGLLSLTRASFLPFAGLVAVWWFLTSKRDSETPKQGLVPLSGALVMVLTVAMVVAPYVGYLWARFGHFIPVGLGGYTFLWANNPEADGGFRADFLQLRMRIQGQEVLVRDWIADPDPVVRDRKALRLALDWIREHPTDFLRLLWLKTRLSLSAFGLQEAGNRRLVAMLRALDGIYWLFWVVALGGLFYGWRAHWREFSLPALLLGWVWLTIWVYAGGSRPLLPVMPFLTLFFVRGSTLLLSRLPR